MSVTLATVLVDHRSTFLWSHQSLLGLLSSFYPEGWRILHVNGGGRRRRHCWTYRTACTSEKFTYSWQAVSWRREEHPQWVVAFVVRCSDTLECLSNQRHSRHVASLPNHGFHVPENTFSPISASVTVAPGYERKRSPIPGILLRVIPTPCRG